MFARVSSAFSSQLSASDKFILIQFTVSCNLGITQISVDLLHTAIDKIIGMIGPKDVWSGLTWTTTNWQKEGYKNLELSSNRTHLNMPEAHCCNMSRGTEQFGTACMIIVNPQRLRTRMRLSRFS